MKINYILTAFSPAMFGQSATAHMKVISADEAWGRVDTQTKIMATRVSHERLARQTFPDVHGDVVRYAMLTPGMSAVLLHYRGPQVPDTGEIPVGGITTFYLIETEEYQEHE